MFLTFARGGWVVFLALLAMLCSGCTPKDWHGGDLPALWNDLSWHSQTSRGHALDIERRQINIIEVTLADEMSFSPGSHELSTVAINKLESLGYLLGRYPNVDIWIGGHTDNIGPERENVALSERRARAVAHILRDGGVPKQRMHIVGYGESQPVESNRTAAGREKNRRVTISIYPEESIVNQTSVLAANRQPATRTSSRRRKRARRTTPVDSSAPSRSIPPSILKSPSDSHVGPANVEQKNQTPTFAVYEPQVIEPEDLPGPDAPVEVAAHRPTSSERARLKEEVVAEYPPEVEEVAAPPPEADIEEPDFVEPATGQSSELSWAR